MSNIEFYEDEDALARSEGSFPDSRGGLAVDEGYYRSLGDGYYDASQTRDGTSLLRLFLSAILKHWFLIALVTVVVTALTIAYVAQAPDFFTASARVQVNAEINQAIQTNAVVVNNPGSDPGYFSTQLEILNGSSLMRRVIKARDLENNEDFLNPGKVRRLTFWQNISKMLGFYVPVQIRENQIAANSKNKENNLSLKKEIVTDPDKEAERLAPYVDRLKYGLNVAPVQETRLIQIQFTHADPVLAAKIANAIGDLYVLQNLESKVTNNMAAGEFLEKRVAELQSEIRRGEERLINYAKNNRVIPLDASQNTVVSRFGDLNRQLGQAETERIAAAAALQAAINNKTSPNNNAQVVALESQLLTLNQNLAQLKTQYTDDWFQVKEVRKQIENVESQLNTLRQKATNTNLASLRQALELATQKETDLKRVFEEQRGTVIAQNEASINYKIIQQEIASNTTLLDALLQRTKENEAVVAGTRNNVLVQDRATIPVSPSGPERMRNVILAFLLSLGFGIGLAIALEWFDDSLNSAENIEALLGLPVLAAIPAAPLSFSQMLRGKVFGMTAKARRSKRRYNLGWFTTPQFRERYFQLGANLLLGSGGNQPRTLLVTSAEEGEGKTVNALSLATSLAETTGSALLIDGDLRCPRIHSLKSLSNKKGLTDLIDSDDMTDEDIYAAIQSDPESNLDLLTSGSYSDNPVNALSSDRMEQLLKKLTKTYKHVVIDSPPLIYFADGLVLARLVDSVVIVVRDGVSSKGTVFKVKKALQQIGANVAGVIINGVQRSFNSYYEYYNTESEVFVENSLDANEPQSLNLKQ